MFPNYRMFGAEETATINQLTLLDAISEVSSWCSCMVALCALEHLFTRVCHNVKCKILSCGGCMAALVALVRLLSTVSEQMISQISSLTK